MTGFNPIITYHYPRRTSATEWGNAKKNLVCLFHQSWFEFLWIWKEIHFRNRVRHHKSLKGIETSIGSRCFSKKRRHFKIIGTSKNISIQYIHKLQVRINLCLALLHWRALLLYLILYCKIVLAEKKVSVNPDFIRFHQPFCLQIFFSGQDKKR